MEQLILLHSNEATLRLHKLAEAMRRNGLDYAIISDNANIYYLTGRVVSGWLLVNAEGSMKAYLRRPVGLEGEGVHYVRKFEEISLPEKESGMAEESAPNNPESAKPTIGLEFATLTVSDFNRYVRHLAAFNVADVSGALRATRARKTDREIALLTESGRLQTEVYLRIPKMIEPGMTDIDLQIKIENELRREGNLGLFRISGSSMELYMANILVGDNADNPTPYDFAMGGAGADPSLPVGANFTKILPGTTVMVDANGNFTGYMTDMTRTFRCGDVDPLAVAAHQCSIEICDTLAALARPGEQASRLYEVAVEIVKRYGLEDYFMGHRQKAGFVGHGVGIEINEVPVIAPRSRDVIETGNVFALEPKFVIPGTGAVGIENTYAVRDHATECLTLAPTGLIDICKHPR